MADKESKDSKDTNKDTKEGKDIKKEMIKKTVKAGLKWKKKNWYRIVAPQLFQSKEVGESFAESSDKLIGRTVDTNLYMLTGNIKKQNIGVTLQVSEIKNDTGLTYIKDFHLQTSSIRKMTRKEMSKVEDSFVCLTSDKKLVRIKPILTTRSKANAKALKSLRRVLRNISARRINSLSYEKLMEDLVNLNFQKILKDSLEKIFPLKQCQIKFVGIENNSRAFIVKAEDLSKEISEKGSDEEKPKRKRTRKKSEEAEQESSEDVKEPEDSEESDGQAINDR